jgi:hypothetical protein
VSGIWCTVTPMKTVVLFAILPVLAVQAPRPVDTMIERLATCKDSWRAWKDDPALGKVLGNCERGDGMRTCGLEIAKERTITLMAGEQDTPKRTLLGCYYFYAK